MERILVAFFLMGLVTYLPRFLPMVMLSRSRLPRPVKIWLQFIPAAVLAALVAPGLLMQEGHISIAVTNQPLIAALPTLAVAVYTRNMAVTVSVGVLAMALLNLFG